MDIGKNVGLFMDIGFAIVSNGDGELKDVTELCIKSIYQTVDNPKIVVSEKQNVVYIAKMIKQLDEFNYNRELNRCIELLDTDVYVLCNNDIVFTSGWLGDILEAFKRGYGSASPLCRILHRNKLFQDRFIEGYQIRYHIAGWCLCLTRDTYQRIGRLNEDVKFWFSDNVYADQLKTAGIKHCLCTCSVVNHIESATLNKLNQDKYYELTIGQINEYKRATGQIN